MARYGLRQPQLGPVKEQNLGIQSNKRHTQHSRGSTRRLIARSSPGRPAACSSVRRPQPPRPPSLACCFLPLPSCLARWALAGRPALLHCSAAPPLEKTISCSGARAAGCRLLAKLLCSICCLLACYSASAACLVAWLWLVGLVACVVALAALLLAVSVCFAACYLQN